MIQIYYFSLKGLLTSYFIACYLHSLHLLRRVKLRFFLTRHYRYRSSIYFIIYPSFLKRPEKQVYAAIERIRKTDTYGHIILIGKHIDYEHLFRHHYRIYGVIDQTENPSWSYLKRQISYYLEGCFN